MMKKRMLIVFLCFLLMATLPLLSAKDGIALSGEEAAQVLSPQESSEKEQKKDNSTSEVSETWAKEEKKAESQFKILDTSSGEIVTVSDKDFCYGALAYEMPPSFEEEALKAQTVALYTYFCRLRNQQREDPDKELNGADFSADLSQGQFYLSDRQLREKWGNLYDDSIKNIHSAVDSVFGTVLTNADGELIDACYHAISGGTTENAKDIFGSDCDYLRAVPSPTDINAPDYLTKCSFTAKEFREKIAAVNDDVKFPDKASEYIGETDRTPSGSVTKIIIGGKEFTGSEIRQTFGLRSAAFEVEYSDGKFCFTVRGYGHGVGMSQWGAQGMAQQGSAYEEILRHYYQGVLIKSPNE